MLNENAEGKFTPSAMFRVCVARIYIFRLVSNFLFQPLSKIYNLL